MFSQKNENKQTYKYSLSIQVDEYMAEEMHDAPNPKVMRKRMYVGGVISKHRKNFNGQQEAERSQIKLLPAFVGCIRQFRVDDTSPQDLVATSRDLVPCAHTHDVAYVHDGGFAIFGERNVSERKTKWPKD